MAERPISAVVFGQPGCADCGAREVTLPPALPPVPDDIDLRARDYDNLRRVMLEDLAARQPSRTQWSVADEEVVLVEAFSTVLDEMSDMVDRSFAEAFLGTARRPASVKWLLEMIGGDPAADAMADAMLGVTAAELEALDADEQQLALANQLYLYWIQHPDAMAAARDAGPGKLREQLRMVTLADHVARMEEHPLVARASAHFAWQGTWPEVSVAVVLETGELLDATVGSVPESVRIAVDRLYGRYRLAAPAWQVAGLTARAVIWPYVERLRMAGTEVVLADVAEVPVRISLSIQVDPDYWRTEVATALRAALGSGPEGFFRPGRLAIGEDLHSSDVLEVAAALEGVAAVAVNHFKRRGDIYPDRVAEGVIVMDDLEVPVIGSDDSGVVLSLHGGLVG